MRVAERLKLIPMIEPKDYGTAGIDSASVNMALLHSIALPLQFGLLTSNSTLIIYGGATSAAKTTAMAFGYRLGTGVYKAANADGLGDIVAVAATGLVLVAATFIHKQVVIEIKGIAMPDGMPWLTLSFDTVANPLALSCTGIADPRYSMHGQLTAL